MTTTDAAPKESGVAPEVKARARSERRILTPEGVPLIFHLAERGERAAAVLIDLVLMLLALVAFVLAFTLSLTQFGITGIAVGQKRGSGLVFNLRERDQDEEGKELNISAQIQLNGEAIQVVFEVVYVESGDSLRAEVPFSR